jgi:heme-degrading monooxygenase HmoA
VSGRREAQAAAAQPRPAATPEPPYYAVIFTSVRTEGDQGYGEMAARMDALAPQQPGYLGHESVRGADGLGITVSYWRDLDAIRRWKQVLDHREAQRQGRERWYARYRIRVSRVERDYGFEREG